jgi:hypothetical protein
MPYKWIVPVTITNGTSLSSVVDFLGGATRIGVIMPAAWTAASLSFQVASSSGGTFDELTNEAGTAVNPSAAVAAGAAFSLDTSGPLLSPFRWFKVRSGTSGSPVSQGADRIINFVFQR